MKCLGIKWNVINLNEMFWNEIQWYKMEMNKIE